MNPDLEKRVPREILAELIEEGTEAFRGILEKLFNVAMQLERSEFLGAEAYERTASRRGYRNGFKGKRIQTRVGELHLEIPQVRGLRFYPKSLERGCRSEKALKLAIAEMYVMGVSTRKVTEITEQLCGLEISATQVSRVAGMLDEELEEFRSRELGEYPIVYLDAHYEKVRRGGRVQDVAILKAIGVNRFGTREVLGLSTRISEAEVHWRGFLGDLHKRGLRGVELFVSDDHEGLKAARRAVYPSVPWNRCQFHLSKNAQQYARRKEDKPRIAQAMRDIFDAPSREDAEELKGKVVKKFEKIAPEFVSWLEDNVDEGLTVFDFPRSWWRRIRTINGLERLHREIRRRTRVVGIFPHEASALRLISAVLAEIHEEWLTGRQYLNLAGWKKQVEQSFPKGPKGNYRKTVAQPWNVGGLTVDNSLESHKPVEIGVLRAQSDSRGGEAGEGPGRSAEALRGDPRGGKGLFSETQGARGGLSSGGASAGAGGISCTTDRQGLSAQTRRGRPRIAKTWRGCRRSQGSPCLRPRCGLSAFFPSNLAVFASTEAAPPCGAALLGLPESYWASRSGVATGAIAGVEGKRIKTPRAVV